MQHSSRILIILIFFKLIAVPVLATDSAMLTALINEGITYHNNRNYLLAIKSFKTALDMDPNNEQILKNLSIAHNNYGKYLAERTDGTGAIREFREALYYDPDNLTARTNLDFKLKSQGKNPEDIKQRIQQAQEERRQENFFAAIGELQEANRIQPSVDAYLEIGEIYHVLALKSFGKQRYVNEALIALETAHKLAPEEVKPLIRLGDIYVARNEISKAVDYYEEAIRKDPSSKDAQSALVNGWLAAIRVAPQVANNHVGLGTAYQLQGDFIQAERSFRRALQLDPNNQLASRGLDSLKTDRINNQVSLFLDRAVAFQKSGNYDESLVYYMQALNLEPVNPDIHYDIGTAFQSKNDLPRAKKAYARALELKPTHEEARTALRNLDIKEQENNVSVAFTEAVKLQSEGQYARAVDIYSRIAADRPKDDGLFFNMGISYQALSDFDKAIESYQKALAIKVDPAYEKALLGAKLAKANYLLDKGIKEQTTGNNQSAIDCYKGVVEIAADNSSAWYNLGTAYQAQAQNNEALQAYRRAFELDPKSQADAIFFAGLILEEQKKFLDAINLYDKYIQTDPNGSYVSDAKARQAFIKTLL
jgi:tetratricopeptide (TPR) repeat protein